MRPLPLTHQGWNTQVPQWKDSASGEYQAPSGKEPKGSYVLDFGGRVTEPSIKNFQVIFGDELDYIVCQFGRTGKDTFTMDVNYPMSIIQVRMPAYSTRISHVWFRLLPGVT